MSAPVLPGLELHYWGPLKGYYGPSEPSYVLARGEFIRLFLIDNGIPFKYVLYTLDEWPSKKAQLIKKGVYGPTIPFITTSDGEFYYKVLPLLRFLSHSIGKCEGANEKERTLLDSYADLSNDWTAKWVEVHFRDNRAESLKQYREEYLPRQYNTWDSILSIKKDGPYILGNDISYVDYVLFHMVEDQADSDPAIGGFDEASYPHLAHFMQIFANRPKLKEYLTTGRQSLKETLTR